MKCKVTLFICTVLLCGVLQGQSKPEQPLIDSALSKKITVAGFCLCKTTLTELKAMDTEMQEVAVEEMDICNDGFTSDARFINGNGYILDTSDFIIPSNTNT